MLENNNGYPHQGQMHYGGYGQPAYQQHQLTSAPERPTPAKGEVELNDKLLETYKPALVFKNFVSLILLTRQFQQKQVNSIDISHDGKYLVAGSDDYSVGLYDLERGEKINTYYNKNYGVDLVKFTHHNKTILCASKRESHFRVMYWSLHDNNILCSFIGH